MKLSALYATTGVLTLTAAASACSPDSGGSASPTTEATEGNSGESGSSGGGGPFPPVARVSGGILHTCALLESGNVKCWGGNGLGELGQGHTELLGDEPGEMGSGLPEVALGSGEVADIAAGENHTCALFDDGRVKCWGDNARGQLGLGDTEARGDAPDEMGDDLPFVDLGTADGAPLVAQAITVGAHHACVLLDDNRIKCWGDNVAGQLGLGDTERRGDEPDELGDNLPFVDVGSGTVTDLASGGQHTCARFDDGSLKCWGSHAYGQLGLGEQVRNIGVEPEDMGDALPFVPLAGVVVAVDGGYDHTCASFEDGSLRCWGRNSYGQLGLGSTDDIGDNDDEMEVLPTVDLGAGAAVAELALGQYHTCVLLSSGQAKCWGENANGQLGLGNTNDRGDEPGEMGDALPAVALSSTVEHLGEGFLHSCAIVGDEATCWGYNTGGQLGLGDTNDRGDEPGEMGDMLPTIDLGSE